MTLTESKRNGDKIVYLNGFKESINYVISLRDVIWISEIKSECGYYLIQCYEQK